MKAIFAIGLAALLAVPAAAQDLPANVCFGGGVPFSPGSTFRAGNTVMKCTADLVWEATEEWSMGCVSEGKVYGPGVEAQNYTASSAYVCQLDGTWAKAAVDDTP